MALLALVVVVCIGLVLVLGNSGVGSERLRNEAAAALTTLAGVPVEVRSGDARFGFRGPLRMGLEIPDVQLVAAGGDAFTTAGSLRFRFALWPLLSGRLDLTSVTITDARISAESMPARSGDGTWLDSVAGADGVIDPDRVADLVLSPLARALDTMRGRSMSRLLLEDVTVVGTGGENARSIRIVNAELRRSDPAGDIDLVAEIAAGERSLSLKGKATRSVGGDLNVDVTADLAAATVVEAEEPSAGFGMREASFRFTGTRFANGDPDRLTIDLRAAGAAFDIERVGHFRADASARIAIVQGSGKAEVERLEVDTGRSSLRFHGAIGPIPSHQSDAPGYRYELVSDGSRIAAVDAQEPVLDFFARLAGTFVPSARQLNVNELGVRTPQGEAIGQATVQFPLSGAPAIAFALDIPSMPVAQAKQLWPYGAAPGARSWVLANVYGGTIRDSRIRFRVPSGRIGNGVALNADEVNGSFTIDGTRFNITGELPPVRDASGVVQFGGGDVDIALSSGVVYMPTGRTVAASNGTFRIRQVEFQPSIGDMDINVAGDAPSVIEFVSYKPIDAMRRLNLKPEDFSGDVSGNVKAQIPLARHVTIDQLGWQVALDYRNVAVAQPFEGQSVTEASGTIAVDPRKVVIDAKARLNGVPAEIDMTEPIAATGPARVREATLVLDQAARDKLAPGLNRMVSGKVPLKVSIDAGGVQTMQADLTDATLDLPWVGWSKGPGIPATMRFGLVRDGERTRLTGFQLDGKSFDARGEIVLSRGGLAEARFDKLALNRGDAATLAIRRSGRGYAIAMSAESFDARSLIKLYLAETQKAQGAVESVPIELEAKAKRLTGFGSETMSAVALAFSSTGTDLGAFRLSATAANGTPVSIVNATDGGGRSVRIESRDAGALLRFLNIYEYMRGGRIDVALAAEGKGPLRGQVDARAFVVAGDPRLQSLVASPADGDGRSLGEASRGRIDASSADFERGFATVEKGQGYLTIDRGVLRGSSIGAIFQGDLYDRKGNIAMTGTFMPAYGVNRLFAEIPIVGQLLGNGSDRGLIGITFKLAGNAKSPEVQVNPMSAIAPGIFRSIFEFEKN